MSDDPNFPIGTASVSWQDASGMHIRVYSCDGYNAIERCFDGSDWTTGSFKAPAGQVSATCWQDQTGTWIRVYCTFQDKTVEWCADPGGSGWYQGGYTTA